MASPKNQRRKYTEKDMEKALEEIREKGLSLGKAQQKYGVPKQTLSDRVNSRWKSTKIGRPTELTEEEEEALIFYIIYMASIAHPLTVTQIKLFAWDIAKKHDKTRFNATNGPTDTWWSKFKKRHSASLTLRVADTLDRGRSRMANQTVMDKHFKLLGDLLNELDIKNKPERIFNCDESGISLDKKTSKVVVHRKTKQAYSESKGSREHITAHVCVSASGIPLPPFIIFEKAFPSGPYARSGPDDALYGISPNGYMDIELFYFWVTKLFIPKTAHLSKPILLILDGHGSHIDIKVIDVLIEHGISLYCLPPHTTNILQPLDVSVFRPLKTKFSHITDLIKLASLSTKNPVTVSKKSFTSLFKEAFQSALSVATIKNGFRKCGIYPFNPEAIDKKRLMPSNNTVPSNSTNTATATATVAATTDPQTATNSPTYNPTTEPINADTATATFAATTEPQTTTNSPTYDLTTEPINTATATTSAVSLNFSTDSLDKFTDNPNDDMLPMIPVFEDDDDLPPIDMVISAPGEIISPDSPASEIIENSLHSVDNIVLCDEEPSDLPSPPSPPSSPPPPPPPPPAARPKQQSTPTSSSLPGASFMHPGMKRVSPLISSGKIPLELLSSFIIPNTSPEKREKNTRVITEARVLTSQESVKQLKEKIAAKEQEEKDKSKKKEERERKKQEKAQMKKEKEAMKEKKKQEKEQRLKEKEEAKRLKVKLPPPIKKRKKSASNEKVNEGDASLEKEQNDNMKSTNKSPPIKKRKKAASNEKNNEGDASIEKEQIDDMESTNNVTRKSTRPRKAPLRYVESSDDDESSDSSTEEDDSDSDKENSNLNLCGKCHKKKCPIKIAGRKDDQWIQCDRCEFWYHDLCIGATLKDMENENFTCVNCVNTL